jgi:hypothetical protein
MSIINVKASWSTPTIKRGRQTKSAARGFSVLCDSPGDDRNLFDIEAWPEWRRGSRHPQSGWLVVDEVTVSPRSPCLYDVVVTYDLPRGGDADKPDAAGDDPTTIRQTHRWSWAESQEAVDCDVNGNPITNSLGRSFDTPVHWTVLDPVLTITRARGDSSTRRIITYSGSLNVDSFYGASPGQAKMDGIEVEDAWAGTVHYVMETYTIRFRQGLPVTKGKYGETYGGPLKAWYLRILNTGFDAWSGDTLHQSAAQRGQAKHTYRILDKDGNPVSDPVPLDGKGFILGRGEPAHWMEFQMNPFRAWKPLGLDERQDYRIPAATVAENTPARLAGRASTQRDRAWTQSDTLTTLRIF